MSKQPMRARRLRTRLTFYSPVENESPTGNVELGWTPFVSRWAEMAGMRGKEQLQAGRLEAQVPSVVRIRWDSETELITSAFRAGKDGPDFAIVSVSEPDQMRRMIELLLLTGKPG